MRSTTRTNYKGIFYEVHCSQGYTDELLCLLLFRRIFNLFNVGYFQGFNEVHCSQICKAFVFKLAGKVSDAILQGF